MPKVRPSPSLDLALALTLTLTPVLALTLALTDPNRLLGTLRSRCALLPQVYPQS